MLRLFLLSIILSAQQSAFAALYKCEKKDGKVEYQAAPCLNARQSELKSPPSSSPQPAASPDGKKQCVDKELSINLSEMSLSNTLQVVADFSGKKLSIAPSIKGVGSFHYTCVPWDSVLADIASKYQLSIKIENETIIARPR